MGAPIGRFIAATNANKSVPDYLENGEFRARPSIATLSNAMDVGVPSNFERMSAHFSLEEMRHLITGVSVSDSETRQTIAETFSRRGYCLDPHSAVGWHAADMVRNSPGGKSLAGTPLVVVSTAHPAKFGEIVEPITGPIPVPPSLRKVMERTVEARTIPANLEALKSFL